MSHSMLARREQREEVQQAFNSPPGEHPVRILLATDAAREGVNLQGHCADLFHYDVPWNPARMEQRNGRIDRTLQPQAEVRCHYFFHPQRTEDPVLRKLVNKVDVIHQELGSLGAVLMDRMSAVMDRGIDGSTEQALDAADQMGLFRPTVQAELETSRAQMGDLQRDIEEAGQILNNSRKVMEFDPALLKDALNVGLELAGAEPLRRAEANGATGTAYLLPELPQSWDQTIDTMRPPRPRDEPFWEWRKRPAMPVVFNAPDTINSGVVHLHLQHPFVRRVLSRFTAQGFSAHDLSRVSIVRTRHDSLVRVIAFGRLSLFGPGATRLHDQLVSVAAQWIDGGGAKHLRPFADEADRKALERLEEVLRESPDLKGISKAVQQRILGSADRDFATLWTHIDAEADAIAHDAERKLAARGSEEAEALRRILRNQREAIQKQIGAKKQLDFTEREKEQLRQFENDRKHMEQRLAAIDAEIESEPPQLEDLYRVTVRRLEPVGMIYLWPSTRG